MKRRLKVVLCLLLILSFLPIGMQTKIVGAAQNETKCLPYIMNAEYAGGKIKVDIAVSGEISVFDIGVIYNSDEVTVEKLSWDSKFEAAYNIGHNMAKSDFGSPNDYVVFGGVHVDEKTWNGKIAQVVFGVKEGVSETTISVCRDSASYYENYDKLEGALRNLAKKEDSKTVQIKEDTDAEDIENPDPNSSNVSISNIQYTDGKVTVEVSANQDISAFDIGLLYNSDEVEVEEIIWNNDFITAIYRADGIISSCDQGSPKDYVVFGGVAVYKVPWNGKIAEVVFDVKDNVKTATFSLCMDSASYSESEAALRDIAKIEDSKTVSVSPTNAEVSISDIQYADGTIIVDVAAEGDVSVFDVGLMYDNAEMEVKNIEWDQAFVDYYKLEQMVYNDFGASKNYIVFGGAAPTEMTWSGRIAQVVFNVKDEVTQVAVSVCKDSATYEIPQEEQSLSSVAEIADAAALEFVRMGDMDGDGEITLIDAQMILKAALRIEKFDETKTQIGMVAGGESITLSDAQIILKAALQIEKLNKKVGIRK